MELHVGRRYTWKGVTSTLTSKWAQGAWNTYTFADGRSFHGDPAPLLASGEIIEAEPFLPPGRAVDTVANPDWKRGKAHGEIVPTPPFLKKDGNQGGPTRKS